jgi:hypothetical protein
MAAADVIRLAEAALVVAPDVAFVGAGIDAFTRHGHSLHFDFRDQRRWPFKGSATGPLFLFHLGQKMAPPIGRRVLMAGASKALEKQMNVEQPTVVVTPRSNWTFGTALRSAIPLSLHIPSDIEACVERLVTLVNRHHSRDLPMPTFHTRLTSPDLDSSAEGADYPELEEAAKYGTLAAADAAKEAIAKGEQLAQAEVNVTDGGKVVTRRILTISVAEDEGEDE